MDTLLINDRRRFSAPFLSAKVMAMFAATFIFIASTEFVAAQAPGARPGSVSPSVQLTPAPAPVIPPPQTAPAPAPVTAPLTVNGTLPPPIPPNPFDPVNESVDGESDWNNAGGTAWNLAANWTGVAGGSAPPVAGDVAWFKTAFSSGQPSVNTAVSIAGLYFSSTGSSGYAIVRTSTNAFTLTGYATSIGTEVSDATAVAIGANNTSGTNKITVPITLAPSSGTTSTFFQAAGGTLDLTSTTTVISGSGILLNLTGGGTISFGQATATPNTYSGGTKIAGPTVVNAGTGAIFGTGTLELNSGTYEPNLNTDRTLANVLSITGDFTFDSGGTGKSIFTGGGSTTGNRILTMNTVNTSFTTSALTLGGNLTLQGTGSATFSGGIALGGANRIIAGGMTGALTISGGITGTGDIALDANSGAAITVSGASINNTGTFSNSGTGAGTTTVSGGIGTNVTGINQTSSSSPLTISGGITLGSNLAVTSSGTALTTISGGVTGAFNLTLNANSSGNITLSGTSVNNAGTITNSGTNSGTATISAVIGTNVTGVIQSSATSALALGNTLNTYSTGTTINAGTITIGGSGTPLGSGTLTLSGGTLATTANRASGAELTNNIVVTANSFITSISGAATDAARFSGTLTGTGGTLMLRNDSGATNLFEVILSGGDYTMSRPIVIDNGASGGTTRLTDFNTSGTTHTYNGIISGAGSFNRSVSSGTGGTTVFAVANTYTGTTSVNSGTLLVNGSTSASSAVTVTGSGSTLGGTGTVSGTVGLNSSATLNPGPSGTAGTSASVGTLTTGALTLTGANTVHIDAFGTATNQWDKLVSTGAIALGSTSTLGVTIASGLGFAANSVYVLLDGTSLTGTFSGITDGQAVSFSGYDFTADYTSTGFDLIAVPEPSTWVAGALALAALGWSQRRRFAQLLRKAA